jgi:hypothetical protein
MMIEGSRDSIAGNERLRCSRRREEFKDPVIATINDHGVIELVEENLGRV